MKNVLLFLVFSSYYFFAYPQSENDIAHIRSIVEKRMQTQRIIKLLF